MYRQCVLHCVFFLFTGSVYFRQWSIVTDGRCETYMCICERPAWRWSRHAENVLIQKDVEFNGREAVFCASHVAQFNPTGIEHQHISEDLVYQHAHVRMIHHV